MSRQQLAITSWNAGEISPHLRARFDLAKWQSAAKRIEGFIVLPEGALTRRPGTQYVGSVFDPTRKSRLIPFTFSTVQAYVLEFAHNRIRVIRNGAFVAAPIDTFVDANVDLTTDEVAITDHGYPDGEGPVRLTTTGTLPTPLALATDYYIKAANTRTFVSAGVDTVNEEVNIAAHGYSVNMGPFRLTTTGALPAGLLYGTDYYILAATGNPAADWVKLSLTPGGAPVNITGAGSGTHSLVPTPAYKRNKFRLSLTAGGAHINLTAVTSGTHTITPTPSVPLEIESPYAESDIFGLHYVQSADVLYLAGTANHPPREISRLGHTMWRVDETAFVDGPYDLENTTATTVTIGNVGTNVTIAFSSVTGVNGGAGLSSADVGRMLRVRNGTTSIRSIQITAVLTTTTAEGVSLLGSAPTGAHATWRLGFFYPGNYPTCVSFFEQRLAYAGEPASPNTVHASVTNDFANFAPTNRDTALGTVNQVLDTSAVDYTLGSNQVDAIMFLAYGRNLMIGTRGAVLHMQASTANEGVTPTDVNVPQDYAYGASGVQPVNAGDRVLYVPRNLRRIYGLRFDFARDAFIPDDLSVLADHMGDSGFVQIAAVQEDEFVVWAVRNDGSLVALTYLPEQEVFAWHRHPIGGVFNNDPPMVESVATIPSADNSQDEVWIVVKRTINASTTRYVERLRPTFRTQEGTNTDVDDAWFADSALRLNGANATDPIAITGISATNPVVVTTAAHSYTAGQIVRITHVEGMTEVNRRRFTVANPTGTTFELGGVNGTAFTPYEHAGEIRRATTTISGLSHLEGQMVQVFADGGAHSSKTVTAGAITLDHPASEVVVGLLEPARVECLPQASQDAMGPTFGRTQRIAELVLHLHETVGGAVGPDDANLDPLILREPTTPMDQPPDLFTGPFRVTFPEGYDANGGIVFVADQPLPMTLVGVQRLLRSGDR